MRICLKQVGYRLVTKRLALVSLCTALGLIVGCASSKEQRDSELVRSAVQICRDAGGVVTMTAPRLSKTLIV